MTKEQKREIRDLMANWSLSVVLIAFLFIRIGLWLINLMDNKFGIDIVEKIAFHIGESYDLAYWATCAAITIIAVSLSNFLHYRFAVHDVKYKDTSNMAG